MPVLLDDPGQDEDADQQGHGAEDKDVHQKVVVHVALHRVGGRGSAGSVVDKPAVLCLHIQSVL